MWSSAPWHSKSRESLPVKLSRALDLAETPGSVPPMNCAFMPGSAAATARERARPLTTSELRDMGSTEWWPGEGGVLRNSRRRLTTFGARVLFPEALFGEAPPFVAGMDAAVGIQVALVGVFVSQL